MKPHSEPVRLSRDCQAVQIPNGENILLPAGMQVRVTQSLGGTFTVITEEGYMARIAGKDADVLGEKPEAAGVPTAAPAGPVDPEELKKRVWGQLRTVFDPEIPVNVVDLGLVYTCDIAPVEGEADRYTVDVKMTLTAPGCGMGGVLKADAEAKIGALPGVKRAQVEMVIEPPWNPGLMTEAAKLQLGML